jgi:hypothetical protein
MTGESLPVLAGLALGCNQPWGPPKVSFLRSDTALIQRCCYTSIQAWSNRGAIGSEMEIVGTANGSVNEWQPKSFLSTSFAELQCSE